MKRQDKSPKDLNSYIGELRAKQRNTVWPDTFVNSRSADRFLLKGSPNPTRVQKVAAWLCGLTVFGMGAAFFEIGRATYSRVYGAFGLAVAFAGAMIFRNGFPKRKTGPK